MMCGDESEVEVSTLTPGLLMSKQTTHIGFGMNEKVMTIDDFYQAMGDIAKETLGYRETKKIEWITPETWRAIKDRKKIKKKIPDTKSPRIKERFCAQYKEKDIEVYKEVSMQR
ncbi:craniofacial development protein 2-like [Elysia marginata]|uniref:Craniofacial development protein 2-like n=1 Tax=Elysia marginata TaxID=1093978 RepID=A0AAV4JJJ9_9GAST|nr:craniofacial development protein 2-like [Elysia marginata]